MESLGPSDNWIWFCGTNSSDLVLFDDFSWDKQHVLGNRCLIDAFIGATHLLFLILFPLTLCICECLCKTATRSSPEIYKFPGHVMIWLSLICLLVFYACALGEGILTNQLVRKASLYSQLHLFTPFICGILVVAISSLFFHWTEVWRGFSSLWILTCYNGLVIIGEATKLASLIYMEIGDISVVRFDLCLFFLSLHGLVFFSLLNIYRIQFSRVTAKDRPDHQKQQDTLFADDKVTFPSQISAWWLNWLFRIGYTQRLGAKDIGNLPTSDSASRIHDIFKETLSENNGRTQLWQVYIKVYGCSIIWTAFLRLLADLLSFVGPLAVSGIVGYVTQLTYPVIEDPEMDPHLLTIEEFFSNGFVLVGLLFVSVILRSAFNQRHMHWMAVDSVHIRSALQTTVYEKSLRLSTYAISGGEMTMGRITNHMSTDAMAMLFLFQWIHHLWAIPVQVIITLVLLYFELGTSALIGAAVFLIVFPLQMYIAGTVSKIQKDIMEFADERLKHSNELLQGMKLLKLYGWETIFGDKIGEMRKNEMKEVFKNNTCYSISNFLTLAGPILVTLIAYGTYELLNGNPLTPEITFSSLAFFNLLYAPIYNLPMALAFLANAIVSTRRLQAFLMAPEIDEDTPDNREDKKRQNSEYLFSAEVTMETVQSLSHDNTPLLYDKPKLQSGYGAIDQSASRLVEENIRSWTPLGVAVMITDGDFSWNTENNTPTLCDINVMIPEGKLTMITGIVGSGKSSLVAAILGEMTTLRGTVVINQNQHCFAYATQKAWLINATVRENILFGQSFDPQRYRNVLDACALRPDIDILPAGDKTEIGEKGINLSGGQKQRISVARALYSNNGLVLLDDPLSALDVHVGSHLFEHGILGMLIKEQRTVILITHQLQYLKYAEKVILMKDGRVSQQGGFQEVSGQDPELYNLWKDADSTSEADSLDFEMDKSLIRERQQLENLVKSMSMSQEFATSYSESGVGKLIGAEEVESGSISARVYLYYINAMGWPFVILVALSYLTQSGLTLATNFWLSDWSNAGLTNNGTTETEYIAGYAALSFSSIAVTLVFSICLLLSLFEAAKKLHHDMLWNVIAAPMRFFDTTPIGRILNRRSNDTRVIDIKMLESIDNTLYFAIAVLASFVAIAVVTPIFVVLVIPAFLGYYFLQNYYIATSRGLQRLESVTRSPVFAHFSETLGGLTTIRAYKEQARFNQAILSKVDINNAAYLFLKTANRWLAFRLDLLAALVVLMAGIVTTISSLEFGVEPSLVGLAIVYALLISNYMNNLVRCATETEIQMNAVERVEYYTTTKREQYSGTRDIDDNWPHQGDISFENISVRYAADLQPVLNNVSLNLNPGEKIGICGRTGGGKSSLSLALFRLIDTFEGRVLIDGIDISSVNLTTLRQRLAIIPQDPVLFTGTIRWNLDPKSHKTDEELWHSLEIAQLKNVVSSLGKGLDSDIMEGGDNFSLGERQLFCLARAFLRNSCVLVMDEATASIDTQTEEIVQKVVQTAFQDKTVLIIAHRVSTILNCDTIIVMDKGRIMEYGSPEHLLEDQNSELSALVAANK